MRPAACAAAVAFATAHTQFFSAKTVQDDTSAARNSAVSASLSRYPFGTRPIEAAVKPVSRYPTGAAAHMPVDKDVRTRLANHHVARVGTLCR
jgi:hypothetical protein